MWFNPNSNLHGIGPGFFDNVKDLKVEINNCNIDSIESKTFSGYQSDSKIDVKIENSHISTINNVSWEYHK